MKKIQVEKHVFETMYEAHDGKRFHSEEACIEHERSYDVIIRNMFDDIPSVSTDAYNLFSPSNDTPVKIIYPRNIDDIKVLNEYRQHVTGDNDLQFTTEDVEKFIVIENGYEWMNHLGSVDEVIESFKNELMNMEKKLKDKLFPQEKTQ